MSNRNNILLRVYIVFGFFMLAGIAIIGKVFYLQYVEHDFWKEQEGKNVRIKWLEGKRGNIFSADEKLLATSILYYTVSMDPVAPLDENFYKNIDELSSRLSNFRKSKGFEPKSATKYKKELINAKETRDRYVTLFRELSYEDVELIKSWPLFNLGKNLGGLIIERKEKREHIFDKMLQRTLGHFTQGKPAVGLELAYDKYLKGKTTPIRELKTSKGNWIPLEGIEEFPEDGLDVFTTVNTDFQYIAHNALIGKLKETNADHGCVVVMEVETGEIKAIVNLAKSAKGEEYSERFNYAIGTLSEPGSTIKTAMLMALLSSKKAELETIVNLEGGRKKYYDRIMKDDHAPEKEDVTLQSAIEKSSNVGVSKLINDGFRGNPQQLIDILESFGLLQPTDVGLVGEPVPEIIRPGQKEWSGVSLPWTAIGYEIKMTPLQVLNFYNSIANGGKMVKPQLVNSIKQYNETIVEFEPESMSRICSVDMAKDIQKTLAGVVLRGTARSSQSEYLSLAGKTGTVNLSPPGMDLKHYQASFAGFFPAEDPHYSCIVVVNNPDPNLGQYYGSQVAAPVFKQVAEGIYARDVESKEPINIGTKNQNSGFLAENHPQVKSGFYKELELLFEEFEIPYYNNSNSSWVTGQVQGENLILEKLKPYDRNEKQQVPNVLNMGLKDALYILENSGLMVNIKGKGKVVKQSLKPGSIFQKEQTIIIHLG